MHPDPQDYPFDLDAALASVVVVRAAIPEDAFTAGPLGTERAGYGVLIRGDGLVQSSDENGEGEDDLPPLSGPRSKLEFGAV